MSIADRLVPVIFFFLTSFLVLFPIGVIVYQSMLSHPIYDPKASFTLNKYWEILNDPKFHSILTNTLVVGIVAASVSVTAGVILAIIVERTDVPYKSAIKMAIILPIIMPLIVAAVAWTLMFGRNGFITLLVKSLLGFAPWDINSLLGVGIVIGLYYTPYPFLFASSALSISNPELEDIARTCGAGALQTIRKVTVPLLKPVIIYSALLIFVIGIEQLSIPLILGSPYGVEVLMTYLYEISIRSGLRDWPAAGVIAVFVLCITTTLIAILSRYVGAERRYISVGGKAIKPRPLKLGKWKVPVLAGVILYTLLTTIIPTVGITIRAFVKALSPQISIFKVLTLTNFDFLQYSEYLMAIPNTIVVSVIGATLGAFYAFYNSSTAKRTQLKLRSILEHLSLYPRGVPGLVLGMGFLWMFLLIKPLQLLRPTLIALMIAYIARYIPYGYTSMTPALMRISQELDWSARVSGASWNYTQRKILLPLLKPALLSTWLLLFITFLREYATAIFLYVPQTRVIGVTILEFWNQGEFGPIAALSLIQLALVFISFIILQKLLKVKLYG